MAQISCKFPPPVSECNPKSEIYQQRALITPNGFREYDARWLYEKEFNLNGAFYLGLGLGSMIKKHHRQENSEIIVGHDYRSYSQSIKIALVNGLIKTGCIVYDIGLVTTPMAYFAQFHRKIDNMAMVTASHNENGWTGVKMSMQRPLTFTPNNMQELKNIVLNADFKPHKGGEYHFIDDIKKHYSKNLCQRVVFKNKIRAVIACGNGSAGLIAPRLLEETGIEVIERYCELDFDFPNYNPNTEDLTMLDDVGDIVRQEHADIGLAFDGDCDRCGFIDDTGRVLSADKVGVIIARKLAEKHYEAKFIADVKSTSLYQSDIVLKNQAAQICYWKTGHSHIKKHCADIGALAAFEKSGHFFFNPPYGYGYDDGIKTAIAVLQVLDDEKNDNQNITMTQLYDQLSLTFISPTMSPYCPDEVKYQITQEITDIYKKRYRKNETVAGQKIVQIIDINGVRFNLEDNSFGLIRASSNKPELVIVTESTQSAQHMRKIFADIQKTLAKFSAIGEFNQKIADN